MHAVNVIRLRNNPYDCHSIQKEAQQTCAKTEIPLLVGMTVKNTNLITLRYYRFWNFSSLTGLTVLRE
jgi:hypothetical protein